MDQLTLSSLQEAFKRTTKKATPHREPDFKKIRKDVKGDPQVRGTMIFLEEHNTGYDGLLERWLLSVPSKAGGKISFQVDLLPGLIWNEKEDAA